MGDAWKGRWPCNLRQPPKTGAAFQGPPTTSKHSACATRMIPICGNPPPPQSRCASACPRWRAGAAWPRSAAPPTRWPGGRGAGRAGRMRTHKGLLRRAAAVHVGCMPSQGRRAQPQAAQQCPCWPPNCTHLRQVHVLLLAVAHDARKGGLVLGEACSRGGGGGGKAWDRLPWTCRAAPRPSGCFVRPCCHLHAPPALRHSLPGKGCTCNCKPPSR